MKEVLTKLANNLGWAYWVEIRTQSPSCTYYFGPFLNINEAKQAQSGYVEDLKQEQAVGIRVEIKRCKPAELTIIDEEGQEASQDFKPVPAFSTQS